MGKFEIEVNEIRNSVNKLEKLKEKCGHKKNMTFPNDSNDTGKVYSAQEESYQIMQKSWMTFIELWDATSKYMKELCEKVEKSDNDSANKIERI